MQKPRTLAALLSASLLAAGPAPAQQQPAAAAAPPTFAVGTNAVAIDVVVRDRKGNLVKDLTQADFEVTEDGQKQQIDTFTVIARGAEADAAEAAPAPATAPAVPAAPVPAAPTTSTDDQPAIIAFVFDRMSAEARNMAHKAALTYLSARRDGDYAGVFSVDLSLHMLQNFTQDPEAIRAAFNQASGQAGTSYASAREQAGRLNTLDARTADAEQAVARAGATGGPAAVSARNALQSGATVERDFAAMTVRMLRSFESLEREQAGFATTNSLLSVVQGMARIPGRKTIVFFSEGISIPPNVQAQFKAVVHEANRHNVAIYTMDAGGLRVHSGTEDAREELKQMQQRRNQNLGNEDANGMMLKDAELNEDLLRLNPQSGLGQLADQTGGFLIRDTNDARGSFRQIAQDMRFHYVLGYTPTNLAYDGRFRQVSVKVKRGATKVFARQGYFAVKPGDSSPLLPYEAKPVAMLDQPGTKPQAFPVRSLALSFPEPNGTFNVPIVLEIPGKAIKYVADPQHKDTMAADVAVVVRIKNEYSQEVSRLSQHFQLSTAAAKLAAAQAGSILFFRQAELPAGRYTMEAIAYDAAGQAASVKTEPFEVPGPTSGGPRMSSLMIIDHVERVPDSERDPKNPLYYGEALLYPNMGTPLRKAATPAVGFYFTTNDAANARKAIVEVTKGGQSAGRLTMDLPAPDANGRVQHAGALPIASFAPGQYEMKVSLLQGDQRVATRSASFTIAE